MFSGMFMRTLHIGIYALLYSAIYYCQSFSRSVHAFFGFLIRMTFCRVFETFNQFKSVESLLVVYVMLFAVIS